MPKETQEAEGLESLTAMIERQRVCIEVLIGVLLTLGFDPADFFHLL